MYNVKFNLSANPSTSAQQMVDQALVHHQAGRLDTAYALYTQALRLQPQHANAMHLLGVIESARGNHAAAIQLLEQSIALNSANPAVHLNLGNAFRSAGKNQLALEHYDLALTLQPDYVNALAAKAVVLDELGQCEESLACFEAAMTLQPQSAIHYFNRANGYHKRGQHALSMADYDRALELHPDFVQAIQNRGVLLYEQLQLEPAMADFDTVIRLDPNNADAHFSKALLLLLQGNFGEGLPLHEWRWKTHTGLCEIRKFSQPLWLGKESLQGRTLLLHAEQGLGDSIQFSRYAQHLAALGAQVVLEVPVPLTSLLGRAPGVHTVAPRGTSLPEFDFHCPMLSLPLALGTHLGNIPGQTPYLHPDTQRTTKWAEILGPRTSAPRIGLAWSGSTWHTNDRNRSLELARLLGGLPTGPEYVSLQRDVRDSDLAALGGTTPIRHFGTKLTDFDETAALCSLLDGVITVDTSVAHLAGALGCPTWLLLPYVPDWRWLLGREDSPWYPTMRLLRQSRPGDWSAPLDRAAHALKLLGL